MLQEQTSNGRLAVLLPPLRSLPPHVSRPGWYPAPLGSCSRQLRHKLKHGMDTKELTSHENKHLCTATVLERMWGGSGQGEGGWRLPAFTMPHLGDSSTGQGPPRKTQAGVGDAAATDMVSDL
jgi:hypothetical protein